ncbi:unnamed protein product [Rotaria sp. Silwood2]|nr:unnamed protein product [Rotaria sp. Silwood2]
MPQSNDVSNILHHNGLSQDAQGHWYELLSPTQVLTGQQQNLENSKKQQKKKKCHGNRKQQHQRRRLRRQQMKQNNNPTNHIQQDILIVIDDTDDNPEEDGEEQQIQKDTKNSQHRLGLENKRKRQEANKDDIHISQSFSELSISQMNPKKTKSTIEDQQSDKEVLDLVNGDINEQQQQENNKHEEDNDLVSTNYVKRFKPRYLRVSDKILKQMLSNAVEDGDKIIQCLNSNEKLQLVRQMTEAANNLYYIDFQRQLWQAYFDLGMKEGVWAPRVSKSFAKQHHTCRSYGFPKHVIEQRQKTITQQLQHTADELHWYLTNLEQNVQQWQPYIDPSVLSSAINECVKNAQQRLRQEFNYKRKMLTVNSNDRHLITKFYELQPNEEQIHIAKQIWQTTFDILKRKEQEEILRKRIFLRRLPTTYDKIIDKSLDYIEPMLSNQALDKDRRASLVSSYSKTITQYKFDLMALNLDTIQNVIRGHQQILNDLRNKLSQLCPELMIQAIENRQKFMQKRHQIYLKHKLHTFFDEAPATLNE